MRSVLANASPVAAGGIVSFHTSALAVRLKVGDRLCDSLDWLIPTSFLRLFNLRKPDLSIGSLRPLPCILLSGLSSPSPRGKRPDAKVRNESIA